MEQERASKEDLDSVAPVWRSGQAFVNDLKLNIEARFGRKGGVGEKLFSKFFIIIKKEKKERYFLPVTCDIDRVASVT